MRLTALKRKHCACAWYQSVFGGLKPVVDVDSDRKLTYVPQVKRICFLRIHSGYPYTQVLGLFEIPELQPGAAPIPGLEKGAICFCSSQPKLQAQGFRLRRDWRGQVLSAGRTRRAGA